MAPDGTSDVLWNTQALNDQMERMYCSMVGEIIPILNENQSLSRPHFISVPDGYCKAPNRLMVVGQQTYEWGSKEVPLGEPGKVVGGLLKLYRDFNLGEKYTKSPFWRACLELQKALNPGVSERAFLWSNLVKVDHNGVRPPNEIEDAVCELNLLKKEIEITRPSVVVFFVGPNYQERMRRMFHDVGFNPIDGIPITTLAQVAHADILGQWYWTYHPNYLQRSGKIQRVLEKIIADVRRTSQSQSNGV